MLGWGLGIAISKKRSVTPGVKMAPPQPAIDGEASTWSLPL
jgi:hypothetical protein